MKPLKKRGLFWEKKQLVGVNVSLSNTNKHVAFCFSMSLAGSKEERSILWKKHLWVQRDGGS